MENPPFQDHLTVLRGFLKRISQSILGLVSAGLLAADIIVLGLFLFGVAPDFLGSNRIRTLLIAAIPLALLVVGYVPYLQLHREIEALRRESQLLAERQPRINVAFIDHGVLTHMIRVRVPSAPATTVDETRLAEMKADLLAKVTDWPDPGPEPPKPKSGVSVPQLIWLEQVAPRDRYIADVEKFIDDYRNHLGDLHYHAMTRDRVITVDIGVENNGSVAHRGIEFELRLPPDIRVATESEIQWSKDKSGGYVSDPPIPPTPPTPQQTRSRLDNAGSAAFVPTPYRSPYDELFLNTPLVDPVPPRLPTEYPNYGPIVTEVPEGTIATYLIASLAPGMTDWGLDSISLWLGEITTTTIVHIDVTAYAETLPAPHRARLALHVEVGNNEPTTETKPTRQNTTG